MQLSFNYDERIRTFGSIYIKNSKSHRKTKQQHSQRRTALNSSGRNLSKGTEKSKQKQKQKQKRKLKKSSLLK